MSSCRRYGRTTCTEKAMSNGVRTAVVVVCGLFIGGLGASGMPVQAHAEGWVAVAADSKGRWAMRSGSEPRREREPRPCGAAARPDAISRTQHGLAASPMWRAVRADIGHSVGLGRTQNAALSTARRGCG